MLAGIETEDAGFGVEIVRRGNINDIHKVIIGQLLIAAVTPRRLPGTTEGVGVCFAARLDRDKFGVLNMP